MNSGEKILISRRASSRKTPETASAADHGLGNGNRVFTQFMHKSAKTFFLLFQACADKIPFCSHGIVHTVRVISIVSILYLRGVLIGSMT